MYVIRLWTLLLCVLWNALENACFHSFSQVCIHIANYISVGGGKTLCSQWDVCEILFSNGRIYFMVSFGKHWSFLNQNEKYFTGRDQSPLRESPGTHFGVLYKYWVWPYCKRYLTLQRCVSWRYPWTTWDTTTVTGICGSCLNHAILPLWAGCFSKEVALYIPDSF